jgi:hypothetical protein
VVKPKISPIAIGIFISGFLQISVVSAECSVSDPAPNYEQVLKSVAGLLNNLVRYSYVRYGIVYEILVYTVEIQNKHFCPC